MAIQELSGSVLGLGILWGDLSGKFSLIGATTGVGTLRYGPKQRILMDVEWIDGEFPQTDPGGVWVPTGGDESASPGIIPNTVRDAWVPLIIGDGVNVLTTGLYNAPFYLPQGEIVDVRLWGKEASGSVNLDIWGDLFANVPPTIADSIVNSNPLIISSARKIEKNAAQLATDGWITTVPAGGYFAYPNIASVTTFTQLFLLVQVRRG